MNKDVKHWYIYIHNLKCQSTYERTVGSELDAKLRVEELKKEEYKQRTIQILLKMHFIKI